MRYKILGKTGLKVSELAFGAIQITRIDQKDAIDLVRFACNSGINLIDTANSYFNSEEILGKALKGIREKVYIISKSGKKDKKNCEEKGIEITDINFIEVYRKQFPHNVFWNIGLDNKVEVARECIECGKCSKKCPFDLNVPEIIKKNIAFLIV